MQKVEFEHGFIQKTSNFCKIWTVINLAQLSNSFFSTKFIATSMNVSIAISMDKLKPLFTQKRHFECRHEKNFMAFLRFVGLSSFSRQRLNPEALQGRDLLLFGRLQFRAPSILRQLKKSSKNLWRKEVTKNTLCQN